MNMSNTFARTQPRRRMSHIPSTDVTALRKASTARAHTRNALNYVTERHGVHLVALSGGRGAPMAGRGSVVSL